MLQIPQDKFLERWDILPRGVQEMLFSNEFHEILGRIAEGNNLTDAQFNLLHKNVGDVLRGFLKPTELSKMLEDDLQISPDIATLISEEVRIKIFEPLGEELLNVYKPLSSSMSLSSKATPFLLHKHEEVAPSEMTRPSTEFERPVFYKEHSFEETQPRFSEPSITARLEVGGTPITPEEKKQETVETPRAQERIVHYSELRTPLDPFVKQPTPENVLDLSQKKEKQDGAPKVEGNVVDLR